MNFSLSVLLMNVLFGFETIAHSVEEWVDKETLKCLQILTSKYFTQPSRYIFVADNSPPSWLWSSVPVYKFDEFGESPYMDEADAVLILPDIDKNKVPSVSGRVILATKTLDGVEDLWRFLRLINVVVLVQNENGSYLYTWFPYAENDCPFPKMKSMGRCNEESLQTLDLFPIKIPKKFNNCSVSVTGLEFFPMYYDNGTKGFEGYLVSNILNNLGLHQTFIHPPYSRTEFLTPHHPNGSLTGLHKMLHYRDVDVGAGTLIARFERDAIADSLPTSFVWKMEFFAPTPARKSQLHGLSSGFSSFVWCLIGTVIFLFSLTLFFAFKNEYSNCLLATLGFNLGISVPFDFGPMHGMKFIWLLFQAYSITLIACYNSTLLMNLFHENLEKPFETLEDVVDAGLKLCLTPIHLRLLGSSEREAVKTLLDPNRCIVDTDLHFTSLTEEKTCVLFSSRVGVEYFFPELSNITVLSKMVILKEDFNTIPGGLYMTKNHPLLSIFSMKVLETLESGLVDLWIKRNRAYNWDIFRDALEDKKPLKLENLQSAFYLYLILVVLSTVVFIVELLLNYLSSLMLKI